MKPMLYSQHGKISCSTMTGWHLQILARSIEAGQIRISQKRVYYTGQYDKVTCFCCDVSVYAWEQKDDPYQEHIRKSPSCVFLKMIGSAQVDAQSNTYGTKCHTFERKSHHSGFGFGTSTPSNAFVKQTPPSSTGFCYGTSTPSNVFVKQTQSSLFGGFGSK